MRQKFSLAKWTFGIYAQKYIVWNPLKYSLKTLVFNVFLDYKYGPKCEENKNAYKNKIYENKKRVRIPRMDANHSYFV